MTYKSILCLNGELPQRDFFEKRPLPVIAADGATNKLFTLGITPHIVIGDLDSVDPDLNVNRLHIQDQSRCDYEKAMEYIEQQGLLPTIVLGSSGGDLDHILNNINIFMLKSQGNLLYAPPLYGAIFSSSQTQIYTSRLQSWDFITAKSAECTDVHEHFERIRKPKSEVGFGITLPFNTKVSLLGLPQARVVTQGLEWDLSGQPLYFPGVNSCLNRAKQTTIHVQVLEGQILFLAHDFFLQERSIDDS
jgi:thiamine pyrophosphokinase